MNYSRWNRCNSPQFIDHLLQGGVRFSNVWAFTFTHACRLIFGELHQGKMEFPAAREHVDPPRRFDLVGRRFRNPKRRVRGPERKGAPAQEVATVVKQRRRTFAAKVNERLY